MRVWICLALYFFSFSCHADKLIIEPDMGRAPLLSLIKNAKSSVAVVMYGFTDTPFMSALNTAKKQGKNTQVLLEESPYKNDDENTLAVQTLKSGNVALKWSNPDFKLTHQKTFIIDNNSALVMTFNLTHSSFDHERNFALLIDDPNEVKEISNVFNADWDRKNIPVQNPNLVWSPDNSREKLLALIQQAQTSLEIYAQYITDYKTIGALAKAAHRGVKVSVITSVKPSDKNKKKYAYLTHAGVMISYCKQYYIHAKVIIVDHHLAMLGSMNLSKPSIDNNRELSIITQDQNVIHQLEDTFQHDWNGADNTNEMVFKFPHVSRSMVRWMIKQLN